MRAPDRRQHVLRGGPYAAHAHDARRLVDRPKSTYIPAQRLADGAQHARRGLVEAACPGENQRGVVLRARVLRHLRVRLHHLGHQRVALDRRV
jgi:hypothetical protein